MSFYSILTADQMQGMELVEAKFIAGGTVRLVIADTKTSCRIRIRPPSNSVLAWQELDSPISWEAAVYVYRVQHVSVTSIQKPGEKNCNVTTTRLDLLLSDNKSVTAKWQIIHKPNTDGKPVMEVS